MCGIAGIVCINNTKVVENQLKSMLNMMNHRGPDSEGFFINSNLGLAHKRLSIIDPSGHGSQPFYYLDDFVLVFNGAIYNYIEIAEELQTLGHDIKTKSDTEILLLSYISWGEECVHKFTGMWAFAFSILLIASIGFISEAKINLSSFK